MNEDIAKRLTEIEENLISTIKEHISNLRVEFRYNIQPNEINKPNEEPKENIWTPKDNEDFFCLRISGSVVKKAKNKDSNVDSDLIDNFNFYKTQEIAEKEAKFLLVYRKLRHIARELNGDWELDWRKRSDQKKYSFNFDTDYPIDHEDCIDITYTYVISDPGVVFFKTENIAEKALSMLTDEEKEILRNG